MFLGKGVRVIHTACWHIAYMQYAIFIAQSVKQAHSKQELKVAALSLKHTDPSGGVSVTTSTCSDISGSVLHRHSRNRSSALFVKTLTIFWTLSQDFFSPGSDK